MNTFKTFILMLALTALLMFIGYSLSGQNGMVTALIFAGVMNMASYWFSDKLVLAMYGAKEIKENEMPEIYSIVQRLVMKSGIPMPKLYIINSPAPNAFATGRNPEHAAVAVTKSIVELLNDEELEGVIAHELSHVKNRDILIASIAATVAGAIFMLARMAQFAAMFGGSRDNDNRNGGALGAIVIAIIAPLAAMVIQMAISRSREYEADASGAKLCGKPLALASALKKLVDNVKHSRAEIGSPTTAHMFIVNPLKGKSLLTLFSTHPSLEDRVDRLEKMAQEMSSYKVPKVIY
ncbi:MAG: zinc metalloprotease HtpX [Elusimicrobia bacterium]|nr:zinc metalloprotease HtpX [Candidatus Liberimonas magnetica]